MGLLVGCLLILAVTALGFALPVERPTYEGGRSISMSIGPIPCKSCSDRTTVPLGKALYLRVRKRVL